DSEGMLNSLVLPINFFNRYTGKQFFIKFKVDDTSNTIFDVALGYQSCFTFIANVRYRSFGTSQLINLVSLETIIAIGCSIRTHNKRIELYILLLVVVARHGVAKH